MSREVNHLDSVGLHSPVRVQSMERRDRVKVLVEFNTLEQKVLDLTARDALKLAAELLDAVDRLPMWRR